MKIASSGLVLALAGGLAGLVSGCTTPASVRPPPHPILRPAMVGGPCTYTDHPGVFTVTKAAPSGTGWTVDFALSLSGGASSGDFVGQVASAEPSVGQTFPGVARQETHGTCTPWVYNVTVGGAEVMLERAG